MRTTTVTTEHVDLISSKPFEKTIKDLTAELGKASTEKLMDRLSASDSWDAYAAECADFAGRSNLIEVGYLNWGKVLTLSGKAMKARCYIVGNPLTAQKLLAAGGPAVGLYFTDEAFRVRGCRRGGSCLLRQVCADHGPARHSRS